MGRPKKGHHGKGHGKKGHHGAHEPLPNLALAAIDAVKLLDEQDEREHHWLGPAAAPRDPTKVVAQPARPLRNKTQVTYRQLIKSMTDAVKGRVRPAARKPDARPPPPQVENYRVLESGEYTCAPRPEEPEEPAEQPEAPPKEDALLRGTRAIRRASPRKSNARKTNALGGVAAAVLGGVAEKPDALSSRLSRARSPRATRATLTRKSKMAMASAGVLRITSTMADVHKATADFVRRHSRAPGGEHLASAFRPDPAFRAPPPPAVEEEAAPDASREEATSLARAAAFQNTFNGLKKHLVGKLAQGGHAVDIKALAMGGAGNGRDNFKGSSLGRVPRPRSATASRATRGPSSSPWSCPTARSTRRPTRTCPRRRARSCSCSCTARTRATASSRASSRTWRTACPTSRRTCAP